MFKALLFALAVFLIATFPATWLLMLFLGNVGVNVSYWGTLPLGIIASGLLAGASAPIRLRSGAGRREQAHGVGSAWGPPSDTALGLAERSSAGGSLEARFTAGCARRRPERSPGDGGSIPPTSTFSPLFELGRENRGANTSENSARPIRRSLMYTASRTASLKRRRTEGRAFR